MIASRELDRLLNWQTEAAHTIVALRRHATGQETLDGDCLNYWVAKANDLTESRVLNEGADWRLSVMDRQEGTQA